ncbi:MAG: GspH/FimT family pseudopilin [Candidatus Omnitrophica bacterium]|nr:GspH/FimT family pseudopilin [Candidatus Omnitrophota bacterium]
MQIRPLKGKKALSLTELVISVAISAVITSVVLLSFSLLDRRNLETAARNLVSDLSWARDTAISLNQHEYIVTFDTAAESYSIYEDKDDDEIPDANELVSQVKMRVDLVSLTNTGGTAIAPARIIFTLPFGQIKDASGTTQDMIVNLSRAGRTKQVKIFSATAYFRLL